MNWKFTDSRNLYATKTYEDGHGECVPVEVLPEGTVIDPADPEPKQIIVVSPRQIRQALNAQGLRQQVEDAIAAGSQDMKDWWEFSLTIESNHPLVLEMAQTLGVTEQQLDDLFNLAATL